VGGNPLSNIDAAGLEYGAAMSAISRAEGFPARPPSKECPSCQGSDRWSYTPPAVCASGDGMCGIAMQAAGIPGPYYSTTHVVSRKCVLGYVTLVKPIGYIASTLFGRGAVLSIGLQYPALGELMLDATGPAAGAILLPVAADEIMKKCSCDK
jgi:hypothetical protein